jgi:heme-degrading monooxygenase HmoA
MTAASAGAGLPAASVYTTGSWRPFPGHEEAFLEAWREFASWSCRMPGAHAAVLGRDLRDPVRFVSFMGWESIDDVHSWKASPDFKSHMAPVQEHVDKFAPTELAVAALVAPEHAAL